MKLGASEASAKSTKHDIKSTRIFSILMKIQENTGMKKIQEFTGRTKKFRNLQEIQERWER